jgi:hypothetical protein
MKASRIALFAVLLFIFQITAGALVTLVLGAEEPSSLVVAQYIANAVVSICVFAYMSWAYPTKPYLMAILVGSLAALFGVLSSALLIGDLSWWEPATLVLDIPALLVAVLLGVSLGAKYKRRGSANV